MRASLSLMIACVAAAGCDKTKDAASEGTPPAKSAAGPASAEPSSDGQAAASAPPAASAEQPTWADDPAEVAKYEGLFSKCKDGNDVESCVQGCDKYDARLCTLVVQRMRTKEVPDDPKRRAKIGRMGCEKGAGKLCWRLGNQHAEGDGVPKNATKAAEYWQAACDKGDAAGCVSLGGYHGYGEGGSQELGKAKAAFQRGCDLGEEYACGQRKRFDDGSWPVLTTIEDVLVDVKGWDGKVALLRDVGVFRGSPSSGYVFARGGSPTTDGVPTITSEGADKDVKKAWMGLPAKPTGTTVKSVTVVVQATPVPNRARFSLVDIEL